MLATTSFSTSTDTTVLAATSFAAAFPSIPEPSTFAAATLAASGASAS